jgi:hypothetical protein
LFALFSLCIANYSFHDRTQKTAAVFKDADWSSLGRTSGKQSWFPANVLLLTGSSHSQTSFVGFYSSPHYHNGKYQKVLTVKRTAHSTQISLHIHERRGTGEIDLEALSF